MMGLLQLHLVVAKELLHLEDRVTASERLLENQLLGQLGDDVWLWFAFPVVEVRLDDHLALETGVECLLQDVAGSAAELHTAISPLIAGW